MTSVWVAYRLSWGTTLDSSTIPLKSVQKQLQAPWQMYEAAMVNALLKQRQEILGMYESGIVDEDQTTARLLRVGIALRHAHGARHQPD
jgi:hypothetical protein